MHNDVIKLILIFNLILGIQDITICSSSIRIQCSPQLLEQQVQNQFTMNFELEGSGIYGCKAKFL